MVVPLALLSLEFSAAENPETVKVAESYTELVKANEDIRTLSAHLGSACRSMPGAREERARSGPHALHYVNYYRSKSAILPDRGTWPVGSVLVKEKFSTGGPMKGPDFTSPNGVAGMIKRRAGFAPTSGDWEFFWAKDGSLVKHDNASCIACHSGAKRDFVFTDYDALAAIPRPTDIAVHHRTYDSFVLKAKIPLAPVGHCEPEQDDNPGTLLRIETAHIFRNARAVSSAKMPAFKPGSVLVKSISSLQEMPKTSGAPSEGERTTEIIAGMIKHPRGTFPKSGDWEFFWREDGKYRKTGLESCSGCHSGAKRDFVFSSPPNTK